MNRRKTDQSRLHQIAVSPMINVATIVTVACMLVGGGITFGEVRKSVADQEEDIRDVEKAVVAARNTAEQAQAKSDTTMELVKRVETTMSVMQSDIKQILSEMQRK